MSRRRTFGSVRKLPSGRYQARYRHGGDLVALEGTFPTTKAADLALAKVATDLGRGAHVDPRQSKETLQSFGTAYLAGRNDWKATTRKNRTETWARYIAPALGQLALRDVTLTRVKAWHAELASRHLASAQAAYRLLRQVLNGAIDEGRLTVNPCRVKGAGIDHAPERQIATVAEVESIVAAMPERLRALVLLATYAGLRRSELLGLRRRDLDLVHREVTVFQTLHHLGGPVVVQDTKTKSSRRIVALPASILGDLEDHLGRFVALDRDALVFTGEKGAPLGLRVLGNAWRKARLAAGRPELTLHDLRHTADTLAAATGATLPELMHRMGHATPHSALRYLHATRDRDQVLAEALAGLRPLAPVVPLRQGREQLT